ACDCTGTTTKTQHVPEAHHGLNLSYQTVHNLRRREYGLPLPVDTHELLHDLIVQSEHAGAILAGREEAKRHVAMAWRDEWNALSDEVGTRRAHAVIEMRPSIEPFDVAVGLAMYPSALVAM